MTKHVMSGRDFVRAGGDVDYFVLPTEENGRLH